MRRGKKSVVRLYVRTICILPKQKTVSGMDICKSAPHPSQITTPAPTHYSAFCRPDALPAAKLTASKQWMLPSGHTWKRSKVSIELYITQGAREWPQTWIKYSLDFLRPIITAEAFEAVDWLADLPQQTWPQAPGQLSDVILLKSTAATLAAAMFVGDRTMASTSLTDAVAVGVAHVNEQSPSYTCYPHLHTQVKYLAPWPLLISHPTEDRRPSWPGCLLRYRGCMKDWDHRPVWWSICSVYPRHNPPAAGSHSVFQYVDAASAPATTYRPAATTHAHTHL